MSDDRRLIRGVGLTSLRARRRLLRYLRGAGISNEQVLEAMLNTPRHLFIDQALSSRAYDNNALPIGFGQTISQPYVVALMTETLLAAGPPGKVLEIGTGSGYQTAVLAALVEQVYSVERLKRLLDQARDRLRQLGLTNLRLKHGDGHEGWARYAPYDAILVTAAAEQLPPLLLEQLAIGGRLIAPIGPSQAQYLVVVERTGSSYEQRVLCPVSFVPLLGGML